MLFSGLRGTGKYWMWWNLFRTVLNPTDFCSCCPRKCIKYLQENDPCFTQTPALPQEMCGPHLKCERSAGSSQAFCKPLNTPCENARKADLGFLQKPPECDAEGNFKPTQVSLNN